MPVATVAASQRRTTSGGPMRTENAPSFSRCAIRGSRYRSGRWLCQSIAGPSGR